MCDCMICKRHGRAKDLASKLAPDDKEFFMDMVSALDHAEMDRDVLQAQWDGDWPDEDHAKRIAILASREPGFNIEMFGLSLCRLENGKYAVAWDGLGKDKKEWERLFEGSIDAAKFFEEKRAEYKLGIRIR